MNIIDTHNVDIKTAPLSEFKALRTTILQGQALTDVKHIERSITQFGLLAPLIVSKTRAGLGVIDGKKRLTAIKRMAFKGTLSQDLEAIPYVFIEDAQARHLDVAANLSIRDFYEAVSTLKSHGHSVDSIADQLCLCRRTVTDFIRLSYLCLPIRNALFKNLISFEQAQAFAVIPDEDAQIAVLKDLGTCAKASDILEAMESLRSAHEMSNRSNKGNHTDTIEFALAPSDIVTIPTTGKNYVWAQAA